MAVIVRWRNVPTITASPYTTPKRWSIPTEPVDVDAFDGQSTAFTGWEGLVHGADTDLGSLGHNERVSDQQARRPHPERAVCVCVCDH